MDDRFIASALVKDVLLESAFFDHPECPFKGVFHEGDPRLVVIVGPNASGKSLLFRLVAAIAQRDEGLLPITISIRERTDSSVPFRRMFMFGDEGEQSTGATSLNVLKGGFHNVGREKPGLLMLDEPELGLSDGYAGALGEFIGQKTAGDLAEGCRGVIVVTHNRHLVKGLRAGLGEIPAFVSMGNQPQDYLEWVASPDRRTIDDLERLSKIAGEGRKITQRVMNQIKEDKNA